MTALIVSNLTKRYPAFVLDGVSFRVEEGRICGLVGANGAGKSTTLKGIMGLIRTEGSAEVFGIPSYEREAKAVVGYAGGGFRAYPQKRVGALANAVAPFYSAWNGEKFARYCDRFGLDPQKKTSELSEGMRVKLSLALALSHGARLLILDEPTSGLDPLSREEFCDTVLSLVLEEGVAVLFSSHIVSDLTRIADDIVLLSNGRLLVEEPLRSLAEKYLAATAPDRAALSGAIGVKTVKEGYEGLVPRDRQMKGVALREPTLDEIIVHLEYERRNSGGAGAL